MTKQNLRGRFKKSLSPEVQQFNASLAFDHILYKHDIAGSIVHAQMLAKQKLISEQDAKLIVAALEEIRLALEQGQIKWHAEAEDIHMFIEQLLIEKIGEVGKKLHTGRSRNDQVALDLKLYLREQNQFIQELLKNLLATLQQLSAQYKEHQLPGYTHLQPAQPISLELYFSAYYEAFTRDQDRLQDWHKRMNFSPLGAGALSGSRLPLDREWVASELGFAGIVKNTLDAVSDRDFIVEFLSASSLIMLHLSRLAEDLIIWATQEFGFISLDDAFATGSSLMPNKKNPDVLELIRGKSGRVFGNLINLLVVMKGLPLAYNKDMQEDKEALFDTVTTLGKCLAIMPAFLLSLRFNTERMRERVSDPYLAATYYLEELVKRGIPFREAHQQIGLCIKEAEEQGKSLKHILETKTF